MKKLQILVMGVLLALIASAPYAQQSPFIVTVGFSTAIPVQYRCTGYNDHEKINMAINALSQYNYGGGKVVLEPGNYKLGGQIVVQPGVTLEGSNVPFQGNWGPNVPNSYIPAGTSTDVTRFWVTNTSVSAVLLRVSASTIRNVEFYYPNQTTNPPTAYPAAVTVGEGDAKGNTIEYVNFGNSFLAVDASNSHERLLMQHCVGWPIFIGLVADKATDVDEVHDVHWNPNYSAALMPIPAGQSDWIASNAEGFRIGRVDGIRLRNNFAYGYAIGIALRNMGNGSLNRPIIENNYADLVGLGIYVQNTINEGIISNNIILATINGAAGIWVADGGNLVGSSVIGNNVMAKGNGIWLGMATTTVCSNNVIYFGEDHVFVRRGLLVAGGNRNTVTGNTVSGLVSGNPSSTNWCANTQGIYISVNNSTVTGNVIAGTQYGAIEATGDGLTVSLNSAMGCGSGQYSFVVTNSVTSFNVATLNH